ncbi:MAG: cyclase family protein [Deferrisomatales bacterium]
MTCMDLSHRIEPGMPVYPGTEPPEIRVGASLEEEGFLERRLCLFSHTGTHVDVPAHLLAGGRTLDEIPLDRFAGPGWVVDVRDRNEGGIGVDLLEEHREAIAGAEFVLLHTGWSRRWGSPGYFEGFPTLTPQAARWLAEGRVKGVGVDAISVDPVDSRALPVHRTLLEAGVVIVENLTRLAPLVGRRFHFAGYPLPIARGDGSPVRAVAVLIP